jgi:hypothetical protein
LGHQGGVQGETRSEKEDGFVDEHGLKLRHQRLETIRFQSVALTGAKGVCWAGLTNVHEARSSEEWCFCFHLYRRGSKETHGIVGRAGFDRAKLVPQWLIVVSIRVKE